MAEFCDVFQGYVILDVSNYLFIGPHPFAERCALKSWASRYTKQEAMDFIKSQGEQGKTLRIQEA